MAHAFTKDHLLTNLILSPGDGHSRLRDLDLPGGNADEPAAARGRLATPTGFAAFTHETPVFLPPRRLSRF
jgi:hypothetical protein